MAGKIHTMSRFFFYLTQGYYAKREHSGASSRMRYDEITLFKYKVHAATQELHSNCTRRMFTYLGIYTLRGAWHDFATPGCLTRSHQNCHPQRAACAAYADWRLLEEATLAAGRLATGCFAAIPFIKYTQSSTYMSGPQSCILRSANKLSAWAPHAATLSQTRCAGTCYILQEADNK